MKDVAPIAVQSTARASVTNPSCFGQPVTLTFDEAESPRASSACSTSTARRNRGRAERRPGGDKGLARERIPGYSPINTDYPPANGEKNGIKKELETPADEQRTLLFPVFDSRQRERVTTSIGWAAFVIDDVGVKWDRPDHELNGHFVTFIATDLAAGGTRSPTPATTSACT